MDPSVLAALIRDALSAITDPRFYDTERGFQGQLLVELSKRLPEYVPEQAMLLEQEYQKTLKEHGLDIRPDIILHQPFDPKIHQSRKDKNFAVFELKRRAGAKKATEDFESLRTMMHVLRYPIGVFINIDHSLAHCDRIPAMEDGCILSFATKLSEQGVRIVEC